MKKRAVLMNGLVALGCFALAGCVEEPPMTGAGLYGDYCAACHGTDAKGGPPVAGKTPPDLTDLAQRHGGVFPTGYVMSTIDGYARERTHGPMPAFGALIDSPVETWTDAKGVPTPTPAALIMLADYLESQQGS